MPFYVGAVAVIGAILVLASGHTQLTRAETAVGPVEDTDETDGGTAAQPSSTSARAR